VISVWLQDLLPASTCQLVLPTSTCAANFNLCRVLRGKDPANYRPDIVHQAGLDTTFHHVLLQ
jgi:hypothetical protein